MSVINGIGISRDDDFTHVQLAWEEQLENGLRPSPHFRRKAVIDRTLAVILLIPGIPIIGLLVLLVRLTSRGPGIYRQARVGKDGRTFMMYKIRTMAYNAEAGTGPVWTKANDMRVTPVGRLLRKLHLDEFPQLVNVLRGDMSLIGPRPERPEFVHILAKQIPGYLNRLAVLPGITGLAQINLPPDSDVDGVRRKLALDLEYIQRAGFLFDVRMFLCTFIHLLGFDGGRAIRVMRLYRDATALDRRVPSANGSAHEPLGQPPQSRPLASPPSKASANGGGKHEAAVSPKPR